MIIDNIKNCEKYEAVHEGFKAGFLAIKKFVKENAEIGKYEIDGKKVYAMIQGYESKLLAERKFEAHKNYIDIQFVISGEEQIQVIDEEGLVVKNEYNPEKDVEFFEIPENCTSAYMRSGDFAILYPGEVHAPGLCINEEPQMVRKIVVKVLL